MTRRKTLTTKQLLLGTARLKSVRQGIRGVLNSTDTRRVRSQGTGSLGFRATRFFTLLHFQFVASLLNGLPHVADHVSCFTHSSFQIISNYGILVINILALSRVFFFQFTFFGQNPIKPCMHTADTITTDRYLTKCFVQIIIYYRLILLFPESTKGGCSNRCKKC